MINASASGISTALPYRTAPAAMLGGATALYRDFLHAPAKLTAYFGPAFDDESALAELAARLRSREYRRDLLAQALDELAAEFLAPGAAQAQIDVLRQPNSLVVFAGQQPGLFTGPLYAIYKALTAERWATDLSRMLSVPVVACYWLCSDDHDFAEVDHVDIASAGQLSTLRYTPRVATSGQPVGRVLLDSGIAVVTSELAQCLPRSEFTPAVIDAIAQCYAPGTSFSSAFARLWYRMFPHSRLLFVTPDHPSLRQLAAPLLEQALTDSARLFALYAQTSAQLHEAGYHQQVHKMSTQTFLFHQHVERRGIRRDADKFTWEGAEKITADRLRDALRERPGDFSPNVLLRPVVQNALFPTVGVVLGPAETAYYAQIGGLHDHFGVPRPAVMPRTSVTMVEQHMAQRLTRHGIDLAALQDDLEREVTRVLRTRFPQDLELKLQAAAQKIDAAFEAVRADVERLDSTLSRTVSAASARAGHQMNIVADKAHAAHKRREQETEAQIRAAALHLFPGGQSQERRFNIAYYWARYGSEFLREIYRHWPTGQRDPLLWELQSS